MLMPMLRPGGRRAGAIVLGHAVPVWLSLSRLTTGSAQFSCSMSYPLEESAFDSARTLKSVWSCPFTECK